MWWLVFATVFAIVVIGAIALEWQYRSRVGNRMELDWGLCQFEVYEAHHYQLVVEYTAKNTTPANEIFLLEVHPHLTLLSAGSLTGITAVAKVVAKHPNSVGRQDGYWEGYILKPQKSTQFEVLIDIKGHQLRELQALWLRMEYVIYGRGGREPKTRHTIIPLYFPSPTPTEAWRSTPIADVLPIHTHLLTTSDTPVEVLKRYVKESAQTGDIVTIAESALAIMQGRFIHPSDIRPSWLAKRLCYYFYTTSSLATPCGLQVLLDESGVGRVLFAFIVGAVAKLLLKKAGVFYQLAGEQARLIDDVTGTLPPYDQFIVLGPVKCQAVVDEIKTELGLDVAIVDVNDLKQVKVLACTDGAPEELINQALVDNPAGNANEQTPIVLIRPHAPSQES
ncbi:MAG: coenzyme F420-0:L-glutamate ligase [Pseudanabaenaceae cyanobacterium]